ncbi:MAG: helix-turn-helix domain-containing protein [Candidatus Accumulibacter delftensis]|jgi:hypothetical protein
MNALPNQTASESTLDKCDYTPQTIIPASKPPIVTGQCAQVLRIIREHQPAPSFELTANLAIPKCAARVHDLRAKGYNIITAIQPEFEFRGAIRRNVALYSMGTPEWPAPGFLAAPETARQRGLFDDC